MPNTRRSARRGYTLVEAMIASVLLSVTVVAISGAISSSYAQEAYARERRAALESGMQLLDEVSALPIDPASGSNPSIMGYNNFSDEAPIEDLGSVVRAPASPATASQDRASARRAVAIERKTALNGADSASGDFAIVSVTVESGKQPIRLKRLVTSAESEMPQ